MHHRRSSRLLSALGVLSVAILARSAPSVDAQEDYNVQHSDGSYEFGYENDNNFHHSKANARNVVRGEFGGRNAKTGGVDVVSYTAGPRGYRPRGSNIARKFDQSQTRRGPIGSRDDPYFDPNEDPSYDFEFRTRTHQRKESANRHGDVSGQYSYVDDVGERHNVQYVAGKKTGFHVKTPFPDSNPKAYGPLFFRGRGRPIPRGRTSVQRGLDGSYRFVAAGPDQRRTEVSDAVGNVRGSYTYLDDKGVQHSVHYIAGPGIGYRVLKNVRGPHLPSAYPFAGPNIIPADFYSYLDKHSRGDGGGGDYEGDGGYARPSGRPGRPRPKPSGAVPRPVLTRPSYDYDDGSDLGGDDLFGGSTSARPPGKPSGSGSGDDDDDAGDDLFGSGPPASTTRPGPDDGGDVNDLDDGLFGGSHGISLAGSGGKKTVVTNLGDRTFTVPPGESVRAHVQSIDLFPYESKVPTPADQFRADTTRTYQRLTTRQVSKDDETVVTVVTVRPSTTTVPTSTEPPAASEDEEADETATDTSTTT